MNLHHTHHPLRDLYLFIGEETFLIDEQLSSIRASLGENASMNYASFNAEDGVNVEEVIDLCNTIPFLSDRRLIVLRNVHALPAKDLEHIVRYSENPSNATTLIMTVEGQKEAKKISKQLSTNIDVVRFDPLRGASLTDWIQTRVKLYGKTIEKDAAILLGDVTGSNTWFIASELEKLSLYVGERQTIALEDVEHLVMRSHEPSIFTFMDSLFDRKKDAAFRLHELEISGISDLEIITRIQNAAIQHYQILFANQGKKSGVHPYVEKKINARRSLWQGSQLMALHREVRSVEQGVKSGQSFHAYVSLSEIVVRFTALFRDRKTPGQ